MAVKRKRRGNYDLQNNLYIPKPKLLSQTQHPSKQYERILREYNQLQSLAHPDVLSAYGNPTLFYNTTADTELSFQRKVNILRPLLLNFYSSRSEEFNQIQDYLLHTDPSSSYEREPAGIRYNILRPLPSFLTRRTYDPVELDLVPYKNIYKIKDKRPRKIPTCKQINNFSKRSMSFLLFLINNKKKIPSAINPSLKKNIAALYDLINTPPNTSSNSDQTSSPLEPTLPRYHGCIKTSEGMVWR